MTPAEWAEFSTELEGTFRGEFLSGEDGTISGKEAAFIRHFLDQPYDVMLAAMTLLVQDGQVFMPEAGEMAKAVRRVTTATVEPFASVMAVFDRALADAMRGRNVASADAWREIDPAVILVMQEKCGEGAARWVKARGCHSLWCEDRAGEYAGVVADRLSKELASYVSRAEEDGRVGMALGRAGLREVGTGPRRLTVERLQIGAPDA